MAKVCALLNGLRRGINPAGWFQECRISAFMTLLSSEVLIETVSVGSRWSSLIFCAERCSEAPAPHFVKDCRNFGAGRSGRGCPTLLQTGPCVNWRKSSAARILIKSSLALFLPPFLPVEEGGGQAGVRDLMEAGVLGAGRGMTGCCLVLCPRKFTVGDQMTVDTGGTEVQCGLSRTAAQTFRPGRIAPF